MPSGVRPRGFGGRCALFELIAAEREAAAADTAE